MLGRARTGQLGASPAAHLAISSKTIFEEPRQKSLGSLMKFVFVGQPAPLIWRVEQTLASVGGRPRSQPSCRGMGSLAGDHAAPRPLFAVDGREREAVRPRCRSHFCR